MFRRHEPADQEWEKLRELLPPSRTGHPLKDDLRALNGIVWKIRTSSAWRTEQYGAATVRGGRARNRSSSGVFRGRNAFRTRTATSRENQESRDASYQSALPGRRTGAFTRPRPWSATVRDGRGDDVFSDASRVAGEAFTDRSLARP
ncbi:transposase [Streptosporangium roseum]|uniref:transposase n=1 Tax=Streptosporangium roseum TaxID=2001 RepID=UPI001469B49C